MDQRLFRIQGQRPNRLLKSDLPALATAMIAYMRKEASLNKFFVQSVGCVHFYGSGGINILVRADDWAKVVPFLRDGTFDVILPFARTSDLYDRILRTLDPLFPVDYHEEV